MDKRIDDCLKLAETIVKSYQEELSGQESDRLGKWLEADEKNRILYDLWRKGRQKEKQELLQLLHHQERWASIQKQIAPHRYLVLPRIVKYAACIILLVSVSALGVFYGVKDEAQVPEIKNQEIAATVSKIQLTDENGNVIHIQANEPFSLKQKNGIVLSNADNTLKIEQSDSVVPTVAYQTLDIPVGGEYKLVLNDGTKIQLNSATRLRFPASFGPGQRTVFLEGEACFDVAPDATRPFVVLAGEVDVRVLGTLFNVKAYATDSDIYTTLARGSVKTIDRKTGQEVLLVPNQQCVYGKESRKMETKEVDANVYLGWSRGHFVFENERLDEIMRQLERWYGIKVFYRNPEVKDYRFTGDVDRTADVSAILKMIEVTYRVKFEMKNKTVTIGV